MRILVLGAGATGGYFGGRLVEAGADVTFLVRPRRAEQLKSGLTILSPRGDARLSVATVEADALRPGYDLVILSCKAYDLDSAIAAIRPAMGKTTQVLPLLNGMCHLDALDAAFGATHVLGGSCQIGALLTPAGEIRHTHGFHTLIHGARFPSQAEASAAVSCVCAGAKFDHRESTNILQDMWDKFVMIATLAGMTTLMRAQVGDIAGTRDGTALLAATLDECAAVAEAAGYRQDGSLLAGHRTWLADKNSGQSSSMFRDAERKGPIEADHIVGDMLARAEAANLPASMLRVIFVHLQAYEARRKREQW